MSGNPPWHESRRRERTRTPPSHRHRSTAQASGSVAPIVGVATPPLGPEPHLALPEPPTILQNCANSLQDILREVEVLYESLAPWHQEDWFDRNQRVLRWLINLQSWIENVRLVLQLAGPQSWQPQQRES